MEERPRHVKVTQTAQAGLLQFAMDVGLDKLQELQERLKMVHLEDLPELEASTGRYRLLAAEGHSVLLRQVTAGEYDTTSGPAGPDVLVMAVVKDGNDE